MAQYSESNILDSKADVLCFAASSIMTPEDIHGKKMDVAPMGEMSALASALYQHENKIATVLAGQMAKGRLFQQQTRLFMLLLIKLSDGRMISPFIVRRHTSESVSQALTLMSTDALFRWMLPRVASGVEHMFALERPIDATPAYDKLVSMLPDYVIIHKEVRYEQTDKS